MRTDRRLSDIEVDDVNVADTFFALGDSQGRLAEISDSLERIADALERLVVLVTPAGVQAEGTPEAKSQDGLQGAL